MLTKFLRGSSVVFAGIFLGKLVSMASNVTMARSLSPHHFGIFLLGLSIFQVASTITNIGVPTLLPSLLAKADGPEKSIERHRVVRGAALSCLGPALLASAALFIGSDYISNTIFNIPELSGMLKVLSAIVPIAVLTSVLIAAFRGYGLTWPRVRYLDLMPGLFTLVFFLTFFHFGLKLPAAYLAFGASSLLVFALSCRNARRQLGIRLSVRAGELKTVSEVFRLSWPLGMESLVCIVYSQVDKLLIGCFLPPSEVGIYAAAASVSVILAIIPQAFSYLALPAFSACMANEPRNELGPLYGRISKIIFQVSCPVFLCLIMLSKEILTGLYGDAYSNGARALTVLVAGVMAACLLGPTADVLVSAGRTKAPLAVSAAGCIANVSLNALLIPRYGIMGAAISSCLSAVVCLLVSGYFIYRYLGLFPWDRDYIAWPAVCLGLAPLMPVTSKLLSSYPHVVIAAITGSIYCVAAYGLLYGVRGRKLIGEFSAR